MSTQKVFKEFLDQISKINNLQQSIRAAENEYNLKKYKITEISHSNPAEIYHIIIEKFYKGHNPGQASVWVENQLRLFLWSTLAYMRFHEKSVSELDEEDWVFFSKIFYCKEFSLFEYQAKTIFDFHIKAMKWNPNEDQMLINIINNNRQAKWNQIAKMLYLESQKKFVRTAKQCRQRWLNHLDPNKTKSCWKFHEYIILFQHVREKGRQWAILVKKLNDRRSEHSIKNKFNAILRKQQRLTPMFSELELIDSIISRARRLLCNKQMETNDEFIFGTSVKNLHEESERKPKKRINNYSSQEGINFNNKFQKFRKKLASFAVPQVRERQQAEKYEEKRQNYLVNNEKNEKEINFFKYPQKQDSGIFYEEQSENGLHISHSLGIDGNFKDFMDSPNCQL